MSNKLRRWQRHDKSSDNNIKKQNRFADDEISANMISF
jgi:hypothetical protein